MYKLPMCRICLIKDVRMHCLANTQLQEIYELLSGNLLETKDTRPLHACYMCCARLRNCLQLRTACLHSEELFSHLLENDSCEVMPSQDIKVQQTDPYMVVDPEIHGELKMDPLTKTDEQLQEHVRDQEVCTQFIKDKEIKYKNVYDESEYSVQNIRVQVHSPLDNWYLREGTQISYISKSNHRNLSVNSKDIVGDKTVKIELQRMDLHSFGKSATVTEHRKSTDLKDAFQSTNLNNCENMELLKPIICEGNKEIVQKLSETHCRPKSNAFKIYKCNICDKRFSKNGVLKVHYSIHSGVRPYKCDTCGKGFIQKCHLKHHIRIHTGDKPYKCDTCGICFIYNSSLSQHIRTHTGEKPYKCNICGRRFNRKYALRDHTRTHNSEKPYKCDMCGKYFCKKFSLTRHIRKHTGEKPYKCDTCGKCYSQKYSLSIHACSDKRKTICLNYTLDNERPHD